MSFSCVDYIIAIAHTQILYDLKLRYYFFYLHSNVLGYLQFTYLIPYIKLQDAGYYIRMDTFN